MGLLTDSTSIRKGLQSKNYFKPETPYDLNSDIVTKTLNELQAAGFNPRSSQLVSIIERETDNTALVKVANQRLIIEMGRRVAQNLIHDNLPIVNPLAIFDKNPNTKFLTKRVNYKITDENVDKSTFNKVISTITGAAGFQGENSVLDNKDFKVGGKEYYKYLGSGQKQTLNILVGYNNYGFWALPNTTPNDKGIFKFMDGRTSQFKTYSYQDVDKNIDQDYFSDNKYTSDKQGTAPINFVETLTSGDASRKALDEYGFGRTSVEQDSSSSNKDTSGNLVWGDESTMPANVTRGLLYYTKNILKTDTYVGKLMNQTNKQYDNVVDGKTFTLYKGNKNRSWTVNDKYDKFTSLLKYNGNGVNNSMLKDSVIPKIYPKTLSTEDNKRFMFSIENLAWSKQDLVNFNLPQSEHGYYGGRLMWFPFYGVDFSESTSADYDETKFMGRIEPVYSFAGSKRSASLKFMLIMDYPPDFKGTPNAVLNPEIKPVNEITPIEPTNNNLTEIDAVSIFFDNDIDIIDTTYELTGNATGMVSPTDDRRNLYSLNKNFATLASEQSKLMKSEDGQYYTFNIIGYASKLSTNDYNVGLGFRRAYNLMVYLANQAGGLQIKNPDNFNGSDFKSKIENGVITKITVADFDKTVFVFKIIVPNNGEITFNIKSNGEESGCQEGELKSNIDIKCAKEARHADSSATITGTKKGKDTTNTLATSTGIENTNSLNETKDVVNPNGGFNNPFPKEFSTATPQHPSDGEQMEYFTPAYHSQTPEDFHKRLTFLQQLTRPGRTIESNSGNQGGNSIFGRQPVCLLSLGDLYNTKVIIKNIDISYKDTWDLNPEGMGIQPMIAEITMSMEVLGGASLATPIDRLQRAVDFNFYANSSFYGKGGTTIDPITGVATSNGYYSKGTSEVDPVTGEVKIQGTGPFYQEAEQIEVNKKLFT